MPPFHNFAWRDAPGGNGFQPAVPTWENDPHDCHWGIANTDCDAYTLWEKLTGVTPVNVGEDPTHVTAQFFAELAGLLRVYEGIFLRPPDTFDTRYASFKTRIGFIQIEATTENGFRSATTGDYTFRKYLALPSSGIVSGGADLPPSMVESGVNAGALRIWNTTADEAMEITFVANDPNVVGFAGFRVMEGTIDLAIRDADANDLETEWWPLSNWSKVSDLVAFLNGRPSPLGLGRWYANALHPDPDLIDATSLVPTGDYSQVYCGEGEYFTVYEDQGVRADISITKSGVAPNIVTTLNLWYDDGEGGALQTANYQLNLPAYDTLGELESVLEGRSGENWNVDVEADSDLLSNNLLEVGSTSVIGRSRMLYAQINIDAGLIPRQRAQPTDFLIIKDPNSFADGRCYIIDGQDESIDLGACTVDVLGGPPSDKVLFTPGTQSDPGYVWAVIITTPTSYFDKGWAHQWRTDTPDPSAPLPGQMSQACEYCRPTGYNITFGGPSDDRKYRNLAADYSNWEQVLECTYRNASNTTPESSQSCFMKFQKGAASVPGYDDWVKPAFILIGDDTFVEVTGCSGGSSAERCPYYQARTGQGDKLSDYFDDILSGEHCCVRMPQFIPEPKYEWRSCVSVAAIVGQPKDNNTFLKTREMRWRVSGGFGALPFPDTANDGWYFQLYWDSPSNDDPDNLGQLAVQLGDTRVVRRYGKTIADLDSDEFGATLLPLAKHVLKSNWLAVKSIPDRWGYA